MTFPKAIANAQRAAVTNDLRDIKERLNSMLVEFRGDFKPHLIGLDYVGFGLLMVHLNDAEAAILAAITSITDDEVHV